MRGVTVGTRHIVGAVVIFLAGVVLANRVRSLPLASKLPSF